MHLIVWNALGSIGRTGQVFHHVLSVWIQH